MRRSEGEDDVFEGQREGVDEREGQCKTDVQGEYEVPTLWLRPVGNPYPCTTLHPTLSCCDPP